MRTPDGRMVIGMNQVFEWAPGVREVQIGQSKLHAIEVRVVPEPAFDRAADLRILEDELRKRLGRERWGSPSRQPERQLSRGDLAPAARFPCRVV